MAGDAAVRIVDADRRDARSRDRPGAADLGTAEPGRADARSATSRSPTLPLSTQLDPAALPPVRAQPRVARATRSSKLWLFLGARRRSAARCSPLLAGLAVAGRAMRPISVADRRRARDRHDPRPLAAAADARDRRRGRRARRRRSTRCCASSTPRARRPQQMIQAQRDFVADASHELRTPLTSILANLELLEASFAERGADADEEEIVAGALGSSRRMRRLVADLLLLARADAGRTGPAARAATWPRSPPRAIAEVRPVADGHALELDARRARSRSTATPTTCTGWSSTWSRTASATRPPARTVTVAVARRRRRGGARGLRRRPRAPRRARRADLRALRPRRRARPTSPPTRAPASAWRSSRRSPRPTAAGSRSGRSPAGGARFTVRLPLGEPAPARRRRFFSDPLRRASYFAIRTRHRPTKATPRQRLAGHPLASSESEPIRPAGGLPSLRPRRAILFGRRAGTGGSSRSSGDRLRSRSAVVTVERR